MCSVVTVPCSRAILLRLLGKGMVALSGQDIGAGTSLSCPLSPFPLALCYSGDWDLMGGGKGGIFFLKAFVIRCCWGW